MPLESGKKLGPYEIVSLLGAGGMGEVYRARDTRLDRTVALKVLAAHLSASAELKQRFEREARALSSLSHPHICHLYDVGSQDGTDFLVMEFLEGETLATRLGRGPLPLTELIRIAADLADALQVAHRAGIIHRDLKPGNIMLTKTGAKLMDFGLAKPSMLAATASAAGSAPLLSAAMTASGPSPASPLTSAGMIVGTIQYMSPEQITGHEADARSDIFSFGAVLYEMATGKRPFEGKSQLSVASAILEKDPEPVSKIRTVAPPALDYVVKSCLEKSPDERFQTAHDVKLQLKWVAESGSQTATQALQPAKIARSFGIAAALAALVTALIVAGIAVWLQPRAPQPVIRATILPPEGTQFALLNRQGAAALSPDGTKIAFTASRDGSLSLWVRSLDKLQAQELPGTDGAFFPFWSPDSKSIGFFAKRKLWRINLDGAPPIAICDAPNGRGGSWNKEGVIIFAPDIANPIERVSAAGGAPVAILTSDAATLQRESATMNNSHRWPFFMPDGKHFIYLWSPTGAASSTDEIRFASLDGKEVTLERGRLYTPEFSDGYLLAVRDGVLTAQKMDSASGKLSGDPITLAENVQVDGLVASAVFSAAHGSLLYQAGGVKAGERIIWVDERGKELSQVTESGFLGNTRLSLDGTKVVYPVGDSSSDLWLADLAHGTHTRLSYGAVFVSSPTWSPDGRMIYFGFKAPDQASTAIYVRAADGSSPQEKYFSSAQDVLPADVSPDGKYLLYAEGNSESSTLKALPLAGEKKPFVLLEHLPSFEAIQGSSNARISPDGNWLAYQSIDSGQMEVYVTKFPSGGGKYQISADGGTMPVWSRDGKRLYYLDLNQKMVAVDMELGKDSIQLGKTETLFQTGVRASLSGDGYDVSRDGRFLLVNSSITSPAPLTFVTNWESELKK